MKKDKYLEKAIKVFYLMIALFVVIIAYFIMPFENTLKRALFPFAAVVALIFFILGGVLIYLTLKSKAERWLKISLRRCMNS